MPDASSPDDALRAARGGDEAAFAVLYREVQPRLLRYLRHLVGADAEDVASETWLQVARDLGSFRGDLEGFRGWVATIGRHRGLDLIRARACRPQLADAEPADDLLTAPAAEALVLEAYATEEALAMVRALPKDQADAVLLRVVMGLEAAAAGKVLGKTAGAVRVSAHRGLRTLARKVGDEVAPAPVVALQRGTVRPRRPRPAHG